MTSQLRKTIIKRSRRKVVYATFFSVCFLSLKGSTFEIQKNVFYFTSNALFGREKIKFLNFSYSNLMGHQRPKYKTRNTF